MYEEQSHNYVNLKNKNITDKDNVFTQLEDFKDILIDVDYMLILS